MSADPLTGIGACPLPSFARTATGGRPRCREAGPARTAVNRFDDPRRPRPAAQHCSCPVEIVVAADLVRSRSPAAAVTDSRSVPPRRPCSAPALVDIVLRRPRASKVHLSGAAARRRLSFDFSADGSEIASEWDENDLDLCIKNYQAQQSIMSEPVDNKNKGRAVRVNWTTASELMLFNIIRKHIDEELLTKRQWNADCFKAADWNVVTAEFNQVSPVKMTSDQIKMKKKRWKQQWSLFKKIRKETGVGWNEEDKIFMVRDWSDLEKKYKGVEALKGKSLAMFEDFHLIFADDSADPRRGHSSYSQPVYETPETGDYIDLDEDLSPGSAAPSTRKRGVNPGQTSGIRARKLSKSSKEDELVSALNSIISTFNQKSVLDQAMRVYVEMGFPDECFEPFYKHMSGEERVANAEKFLALNEHHRRLLVHMLR